MLCCVLLTALGCSISSTGLGGDAPPETEENEQSSGNGGGPPAGAALVDLEVSAPLATLAVGESMPLTATASYSDGSNATVTATAAWQSTDSGVATVDGMGHLTAVSGGSTTIFALLEGVVSNSVLIEVAGPAVIELSLDMTVSILEPGEVAVLTVTATFTTGEVADVTGLVAWSNDAPQVIELTPGSPALATALSDGSAVLTAALGEVVSGSVTLQVETFEVEAVILTASAAGLTPGESVMLEAVAVHSGGQVVFVSDLVVWENDDPEIVTISGGAPAVATGLIPGSSTILASYEGIPSNSLTLVVHDPASVPLLVPGSGFSGPTAEPGPVGSGAGADARAIARWDGVPYQTVEGEFAIGVVAFHTNGIDRVEMAADGGPWTPIEEMTLNPRTGVWEYWAVLRASDLPDGPVEVRAIAFPTVGKPRLLEPLRLASNHGGTLPALGRHVSPTGSDADGDGSAGSPYATILRAARAIQDAAGSGTADGGTVYLHAGSHDYGAYSYALKTTTADRWLTIRPAPGLTRADVTLSSSSSDGLRTRLVHLVDLTIRTSLSTNGPLEDHIWLDGCLLIGNGRATNISATGFVSASAWSALYGTDLEIRENRDGLLGARICRSCLVTDIGSDAFTNSWLVLSSSVTGIDNSGTSFHPDVYQFSGTGASRENVIVYGLEAYNAAAQGIFADDLATLNNVAFVNVVIEETGSYQSQWKDVSTDHLLLWGVTLVGHPFAWRTASLSNLSVTGGVFEKMTTDQPLDASGFHSNHYIDATSSGAITPGADTSSGDPAFLDPSGHNYRPADPSPLRGRLATPPVPVDTGGTQRTSPTSVGAWH